jgi:hypothetical protein
VLALLSFKRSVPILISIFLLFASAFLVAPSAKPPCACVDLAPGEPRSTESDGQPSAEQTRSQGSLDGSIGQTPDVKGFQSLPWGATPSRVKNELGNPSWGSFNNWQSAWVTWHDQWEYNLPKKIDAIMGWSNYKFDDVTSPAQTWAGFTNMNRQKRLVWVYVYWSELSDGDFDYVQRTTHEKLVSRFGEADVGDENGTWDDPLYFPSAPCCEFTNVWTGRYGTVRWGHKGQSDREEDWVAMTYQSKLLTNRKANFPPEGKKEQKSAQKSQSTGGPLESGLEGERFGHEIAETKSGRIDGFRSLPWGSTPSAVESEMGAPSTRKARETEPYNSVKNMSFPDEGEEVWAYEQEILGEKAYIYVAFDRFHVSNDLGLVWAATAWDANENIDKKADAQRIYNELRNKIFVNEFGEPSLTDENDYTEAEKPKFWMGGWWSTNRWKDEYGRLHLRGRPGDEGVMVYFQSAAMIEKRKTEVEEAESKF